MKERHSLWFKIHAYHLQAQAYVLILVVVLFLISLVLYSIPHIRENVVGGELMLALFTSLLVTIFTMTADIFVSFKQHKSDEYLEEMHSFGIGTLYKNKEEALVKLLADCDKTVWISGYRLILTRKIIHQIDAAIDRGARVTAVICPPWSVAYGMVYGDSGKVMDNYYHVFNHICQHYRKNNYPLDELTVCFVNKPIFSDTYKVDQNLITGPYMHNRDNEFKRLMAKDFFSYDIVRQSKLFELINNEFLTLCDEAVEILDPTKMEALYDRYELEDWTEAQKIEEFRKILIVK